MTVTLYQGDCLEIMRTLTGAVNCIITDPPYPDYYADLYGYDPKPIEYLDKFSCRQLVFWTAKADFPLSYTAIHIWDKKTGCGSQYERIFERNGGKAYRVFRYYLINSTVAASFTGDEFTGHPSQKPIKLLIELIEKFTKPSDTILDPFAGSGTTGVAAIQTGRNAILIEKDPGYFAIAQKRIAEAQPCLTASFS